MPSLQVSSVPHQNTFQHFHSLLIKHYHEQHNVHRNPKSLTLSILEIATISIMVTCCIFMMTYGWVYIAIFHYNNTYEKYQLYYLYNWILHVILEFISLIFIVHIFMNGYYNHSLKHNCIIAFLVCLLFHGTVTTLLTWQYSKYNNYWYFKWLCNNILTSNDTFQIQCKHTFSIFSLYSFVFGYPLCLLLIILLKYIIFLMFGNKVAPTIQNSSTESYGTIEIQDLNDSLISHNMKITQRGSMTLNKKSKFLFCLYIVFTLLVFLFYCQIYFASGVLYFYNVRYYFYCLSFSATVFKLILKFIARKIDINNMIVNYNSTKWYYHVSMELFVEFSIDFVYFLHYYNLFIYELSSKNIDQVLSFIFLHLFTESCQSLVRFSAFYFNQTSKIYSQIEWYCNNKIDKGNEHKFLSLILYVCKDDSNISEWRIRHSIDSSIRCICLICSFFFFSFEIIIVGVRDAYMVLFGDSGYYNGILYFCLSFSCDWLYFSLIFLFNYYFNNYFNIFQSFAFMYNANGKVFVFSICSSLLFALFLWQVYG